MTDETLWPPLPYDAWKETCSHLHLMTQIVGKVRLKQTPWVNHSWHVALYVTPRGLTTGPIPHGDRIFDIAFDFIAHELHIRTSEGGERRIKLQPRSVASFHGRVMDALQDLNVPVTINDHPNEIPDATPFTQDHAERPYDAVYAHRFWRALVQADRIFKRFRTSFLGKVSPGAFLLGQLRSRGDAFLRAARAASSGRRACASRRGDARGLFARSQQRGLLAGRPRLRRRVLFLRLSRARRFPRHRDPSERCVSSTRTFANSFCPMTPSARQAIRIGCCSTSSIRPTKRQRPQGNGTARISNAAKASPASPPGRRRKSFKRAPAMRT